MGSCTYKTAVGGVEQHLVLSVERFCIGMVMDVSDTLVQSCVGHNVAVVLREHRLHLLCHGVQFVAGVGAQHVVHVCRHHLQSVSRMFQCHDSVGEGGRFRVSADGFYLGLLFVHGLQQSRLDVLHANFIEGEGAIRGVEGKEEWISIHVRKTGCRIGVTWIVAEVCTHLNARSRRGSI